MGIAYKIQGRVFSDRNFGRVTPIERVGVIDFTTDTTEVRGYGYLNLIITPHWADYYDFVYESLDTAIALVDRSSGLVLPQVANGSANIKVTETISGISKTFTISVSDRLSVDFTPYIVNGKRPPTSLNRNGMTYYPENDSGQSYTPAQSFLLPEHAMRIIVNPFYMFVSSNANNDAKGVIFLDSSNIVVAGYNFYELYGSRTPGQFNIGTDPVELPIPDTATCLCICTCLTTQTSQIVYTAPIIDFLFN